MTWCWSGCDADGVGRPVEKDAAHTDDECPRDGHDGTFTAGADGHVAAYLTAAAEGLTGQARVRIVPSLPWHFDFEDTPIDQTDPRGNAIGEPPVTWVGARYRHVVREADGSKVMVKITTIPKGTRSRSWMGHSDMHDYTIQADVRGSVVDGKMPDIGLIAQGALGRL